MLIRCFEKIYDNLKESRLKEENLKQLTKELDTVQNFFDCDRQSAALLSVILMMSMEDQTISLHTIIKYLGLRSSTAMQAKKYLGPLLKRNIIRLQGNEKNFHRILLELPAWLFDAITTNDKQKLKPERVDNAVRFLQHYGYMLTERKNNSITTIDLYTWLEDFTAAHRHISFVNWLHDQQLTEEEAACFLYCCLKLLDGDEDIDVDDMLKAIITDLSDRFKFRKSLRNGTTKLVRNELIELCDVWVSSLSFINLSEKAVTNLLEADAGLLKKEFVPKYSALLRPEKITTKQLQYSDNLLQQVTILEKLFDKEQMTTVQQRLKDNGMVPGVTILLYGSTGTGKTETVLQLARKTNRHILQVEISKVRSMWVGETEKNIKKVFNEYRDAMKYFELCPILLFNEADAILGKRRELAQRTDQMENTLQNILLQELETFEGIFMATTNLTANLDPAFERRLLYKILFENPTESARLQIWKEKFPTLNDNTLTSVSSSHELTGGQIENIRKKVFIDSLLQTDAEVDEEKLLQLAGEESLVNKERVRRVVGFSLMSYYKTNLKNAS